MELIAAEERAKDYERENARLRDDLDFKAQQYVQIESDLVSVMAEWREKVGVFHSVPKR